jgi:IPT/TIG domain-containing protein
MTVIPNITSLSPVQGHEDLIMTMAGTGLLHTISVNFGAKRVVPDTVTSTQVTCDIPEMPPGDLAVPYTDIPPCPVPACPLPSVYGSGPCQG